MKTIGIKEFSKNFIIISKNLTIAEVRMLYLLITDPEYMYISQQDFAKRIGTHRRTINIGFRKLKEFEYISDFKKHNKSGSTDKIKNIIHCEPGTEKLTKKEIRILKEFIIHAYTDYYEVYKRRDIVINEDFLSFVLRSGKFTVDFVYKYRLDFITNTIKSSFPTTEFYFEKDKTFYVSEKHYTINRTINNEIIRARKAKRSHVKLNKIVEYLHNNYSITQYEIIDVLKTDFRNLRVVKNQIIIPNYIGYYKF
jgi:hypothetical protein